ncbi:MAG TPA: DUF3362 domain-containing protein [Urbifossiella sp.]|jgi:hypothetical protein|nr:DUF3362 domain-containing protein [Urbifossiella sp.]
MWATPDIATCVYHTGVDPFTKKPVTIARGIRDRKMQRALMPFFKPENDFLVRDALAAVGAGRPDWRVRRVDPGPPAEGGDRGPPAGGESSRPRGRRPLPHGGQPGAGREAGRAGGGPVKLDEWMRDTADITPDEERGPVVLKR